MSAKLKIEIVIDEYRLKLNKGFTLVLKVHQTKSISSIDQILI